MARILVIEDDGDLQELMSLTLTREGYDVHYAFNGKEGYDKILSLQPDLILLDLKMPVLGGTEVIKLVVSNTLVRDIPIIVMTAYGDRPELLEATLKAYGAREYVRKPLDMDRVLAMIRRLLAQYPRRAAEPAEVAKGVVRLDKRFRTLWISDRMVATLSPVKARLLALLLEAKGPVKRERLLEAVWGGSAGAGALEKAVQRLREDLGAESARLQTTAEGYELLG
jgi:DNA-binding response OmpR family regulator